MELARRLLAIESTTGEEAAVAEFLYGHLRDCGWDVEKIPVEANRWNLFARRSDPRLVFSTHLDTVPPFVAVSEDDTFLFGRGACDAKGIAAAQIAAAEELRATGVETVALLFVVGEERNSAGALAANRWIRRQPFAGTVRHLINGEPTDNRLAVGTKGSLRCALEARGKSAHSAYPELGENAIDRLLEALEQIRQVSLRSDAEMGNETLNIGTIAGGTRPNVVPDSASAEIMFRLVADSEPVKQEILRRVGSLAQVRFEFEVPPVRLRRLPGFEGAPMAFTTDIPFLSGFGEPFLLGPGSIHDAHTLGEKISKEELVRGAQLYVKLARFLLSEP